MEKIQILNIPILSTNRRHLLENMHEGLFFTPNVDHLVNLQKDSELYRAYQQADWIVCDSKIVNLAAKFVNKSFEEVIPGSSFFPAYYEYHKDNKNVKVFLLGAAEGIAVKARENINKKVGREIIVGAHSPSFGFEKNAIECERIVDIINQSNANVLLVGVGSPKQEKWIIKYKKAMPNIKVFMALGATIDFEAGNVKRAPILFQKMHCEWLYRLLKEPRRLWKRYLIDDMQFFTYIFKQKIGMYKNPFSHKH